MSRTVKWILTALTVAVIAALAVMLIHPVPAGDPEPGTAQTAAAPEKTEGKTEGGNEP